MGDTRRDICYATKGYVVEGNDNMVYKLKMALYSLKQAPRAWFSRIHVHFQQHGFIRSKNENTIYKKTHGGEVLLLSL